MKKAAHNKSYKTWWGEVYAESFYLRSTFGHVGQEFVFKFPTQQIARR